jgi:hypothetical protein
MDRDVQDSFKVSYLIPCFAKLAVELIETIVHFTSFVIKYTNILYNFDILVITLEKNLGQIIWEDSYLPP